MPLKGDTMIRSPRLSGRTTTVAIVFLVAAGFGAYEIRARAPLAAHAPLAQSQLRANADARNDASANATRPFPAEVEGSAKTVSAPYEADHLDADFVDYSHAEPLPADSVRGMAGARFVGLSADQPNEPNH
jgi:hypothetical protein